jgi:hypothetical protein
MPRIGNRGIALGQRRAFAPPELSAKCKLDIRIQGNSAAHTRCYKLNCPCECHRINPKPFRKAS